MSTGPMTSEQEALKRLADSIEKNLPQGSWVTPGFDAHTAVKTIRAALAGSARPAALARSLTDELMDCVDRLGGEWKEVDPRVWGHLLVYVPKELLASQAQAPTAVQPESLGAPASPSGSAGSAPSPSVSAVPAPIPGAVLDALNHAEEWINSAGHGDDCFVSDHYEGDPGNCCNCGRDSVQWSLQLAAEAPGLTRNEDGVIVAAARGIEPEGRESEGPRAKPEEPGPAGSRPSETSHQENQHD